MFKMYCMEEKLKDRTKQLGINTIKFVTKLDKNQITTILSNQIIRSSTSVGVNYRAVCRAKSSADFINKLRIVEEEADETIYWFEVLEETMNVKNQELTQLKNEADEILSIIVASIKTSLKNQESKIGNPKSAI